MTERKEVSSAFGELETTETLTMDQIEAKARDLLAQLSLDEVTEALDRSASREVTRASIVAR
jgi:hypothetical protein